MHHAIAFILIIFLFVSGFVMVSVRVCDNVNRRIDKQNINLAGKIVTEYASYDADMNVCVDEGRYIRELQSLISDKITGGIFVYEKNIRGVDSSGKIVADISTAGMTEKAVVTVVNNILYELIEFSEPLVNINVACSDEYIKNKIFNNIQGVTVFTVTYEERNGEYTYNVVGYCIFPHINI